MTTYAFPLARAQTHLLPALSPNPCLQYKYCSGNLLMLSPLQSSDSFQVIEQHHMKTKR